MDSLEIAHDVVILDGCCVICLYASGFMQEIISCTGKKFVVASYVLEHEAKYIYSDLSGLEESPNLIIDLQPHLDSNLIQVVSEETEQEDHDIINLSGKGRFEQGRGEAITGAIAKNRNWAVATDDRKATRVFREFMPQIQIISTLMLVKNWEDTTKPPIPSVQDAINNIQARGSYKLSKKHIGDPLIKWALSRLGLI